MKELDKVRVAAGVEVSQIAEHIGVSYVNLAKIFHGVERCPEEIKEDVKNFLIKNYTERIERIL